MTLRVAAPVLAAVLATTAAGCAKPTTMDVHSESTTLGGVGDAKAGRQVFDLHCATCHGASGIEGGVGPSLRGENVRKNYDATIAWVKHPQPPMPRLFPSELTEQQVDDVAAYVQKL